MDKSTSSKTCTECSESKRCPACALAARRKSKAAYMARWRAANPDLSKEIQRAFKRENPELVKVYRKRFVEKHPEKKREWDRLYRASNSEKIAANKARYYLENSEEIRAKVAAWQVENAERYRELKQRRRARILGATVGAIDVAALWTGSCGICAEPLSIDIAWPDSLSKSLDHIVPLCVGGPHSQENLQWTHLVCNLRKAKRAP